MLDSSLSEFLTCTGEYNAYVVYFMQQDKVPSMVGGIEWILNDLILRMVSYCPCQFGCQTRLMMDILQRFTFSLHLKAYYQRLKRCPPATALSEHPPEWVP